MTAAPGPHPRTFSLLLVFLFMFSLVASAQTAGLSGRVTDPDGRTVANAEVIVTGPLASPLRARTDGSGTFTIADVPPGTYHVIATAPGLVSDPLAIEIGDAPATADLRLRLTAVAETLVVSASQIDQPLSRTPDSVTVIGGDEIEARQQYTLGA
jgi:hypothetical protein